MFKRSFADYVTDEPALARAHQRATQFVSDILAHPWSDGYCLTLAGQSGTGKTMLCELILSALRLSAWGSCDAIPQTVRGGQLLRFTAGCYDMRRVSKQFKNGQYGIAETMQANALTVIDDLGADHDPSKNTVAQVDEILRGRRGKWTLVTVNKSLQEIKEDLDGRIASFLIRDDNKFFEIQAEDFAKRKFKGRN